MLPLANTKVSILRGTGNDAYGDEIDTMTPYETDVPALLTEEAQTVFDPATQEPRTVRTAMCYVPPWLDVLNTDQVYDQLTGDTFMVIDIVAQPWLAPGGSRLTTLKLRRVSAAAP
jgi:hypothetical protein